MRVLLVVLMAIGMSGCIDSGPGEVDDPATQGPFAVDAEDVIPWGLEECDYIVSFGRVEAERLVPYLPEGFTPRPNALAPGVPYDTWFGFDIMTCASGIALNGSVAPMTYGYLWASADPPTAYLQEDVDVGEHYAKWDVLVPDAQRRAVLASRGVPVHDGDASLRVTPAAIEGTLVLDGLGTFTITAAPAVERTSPFEGSFVKISAADGGVAAWRASAESGPRMTGAAVLTFEPGSWAADVVDGTELAAQFHSGTWSYTDAEIRFLQAPDA